MADSSTWWELLASGGGLGCHCTASWGCPQAWTDQAVSEMV